MKEKSDYKEIYEHIYVRLEKINIYLSIYDDMKRKSDIQHMFALKD